jgi:hypothetical protein
LQLILKYDKIKIIKRQQPQHLIKNRLPMSRIDEALIPPSREQQKTEQDSPMRQLANFISSCARKTIGEMHKNAENELPAGQHIYQNIN